MSDAASDFLIASGGVESWKTVGVQSMQWLAALSPDLARDAQWMESVEVWRVDRAPGPWTTLFKWLLEDRPDGEFSPLEIQALLDFLGYIGSANALRIMSDTVEGSRSLEALLQAAVDRRGAREDFPVSTLDPVAQVTVARVRRLLVRQFFERIFSPERRAYILDLVLSQDEGWAS